ncbi:MAG: redoxin domain-containing protein [Planctomycetaceae bacterium]|nr:redoxin domain-containing protein [Planctomycetaceae bacterium]
MRVPSLCIRAVLCVLAVSVSAVFVLGLNAYVAAQDPQPQTQPVLLQMIRDDAIHRELGLSDDQVARLMDALREVDPPWFRARVLPAVKQRDEIVSLTSQLRRSLQSILDAKQLLRLRQLEHQALGTRMVLRDEVVRDLELRDDQVQSFVAAFLNTDQESSEIQKAVREGKKSAEQGNRELGQLKTKERQSLVAQLSPEQKVKLGRLTGEAFSFSEIRRSYPLAPELTAEGVTWIQGGPLSLEATRGKVVAVHFYAFQCINCQRNFDHYQKWYEDYADDGLVIIGIQTPETSAERQLDRVTSAVKSDGMTYPVLLDGESKNWKAWSNTMWPTVYLVDRKGFLRRWWQGELNWKETRGEQQMRETIEQLLSEK